MYKRIPYMMSKDAWVVIAKDGLDRGHEPLSTPFFVDEHTMTGMMLYFGVPWLFPVEKKNEAK